MTYKQIQREVIQKYNVKINTDSDCWGRTHVHIKKRMVCKWKPANSVRATFTLLHEVGHIENNHGKMRRCEEEYHATVWAIARCHEYGIVIPDRIKDEYQRYIDRELERGIRRGGKGYPKNLKLLW